MKLYILGCERLRNEINKRQMQILEDLALFEETQKEAEALLAGMLEEQTTNLSLLSTFEDAVGHAEESDAAVETSESSIPTMSGTASDGDSGEPAAEEESLADIQFKEKSAKMDELIAQIRNRQTKLDEVREKKREQHQWLKGVTDEYDEIRRSIKHLLAPELPGAIQLA